MQDDTKTLYLILDILFWIHKVTFGFGYVIEILIIFVFIKSFFQKKPSSDISSAYFILFFSTMILDLPLMILRYPTHAYLSYFFNGLFNLNEDDADAYFMLVKTYFSFCQLFMTFNRFTGLLYPINHAKIWSKRNVFLAIIVPFIISLIYYITIRIIYSFRCFEGIPVPFMTLHERYFYDVIISTLVDALSLFLSCYIFYKINPCSNKTKNSSHLVRKAEIRLFYVSLFINIMSVIRLVFDFGVLNASANTMGGSFQAIVGQEGFKGTSNLAYFFQHYIGIIVFICTSSQLRACVFKFYFIDKLILVFAKHFSTFSIQSTPSVSNDSLFYRRQQNQNLQM